MDPHAWLPGDSVYRWAPLWLATLWAVALVHGWRRVPRGHRVWGAPVAVLGALASLEMASAPALTGPMGWDRMVPHPVRIWWNPPNDPLYGTNSAGFRNACEVGPRSRPRVLCVGDSWTFGKSVGAAETWAAGLEQRTGFEVINAGCRGYSLSQAWLALQEFQPRLEPDVLVLSNARNFEGNSAFAALGVDSPGEWKRPLYGSHLYLWLRREYHRYLMGQPFPAPNLPPPPPRYELDLVRRMARHAEAGGTRVVILLVGDQPGDLDAVLGSWRALARSELHVPVVQVDMSDPRRRAPGDPTHPDAEGHRQIAEALAPAVAEAVQPR